MGQADTYAGVLLLAERSSERWFERLCERADTVSSTDDGVRPWTFQHMADDPRVLLAQREGTEKIFVVAGRQIISSEGLEVLALATTEMLPDGLPAQEIIQAVREGDGIAVLPWGVGKWLGRRGGVVRNLLESDLGGTFYLGDNGGRPAFWGTPSPFKLAHSLDIRILPGTDPLPVTWEASRVGSFGFTLPRRSTGEFSLQRDLLQPLRTNDCAIGSYGDLLSGINFVRNQLALKLLKRSVVLSSRH